MKKLITILMLLFIFGNSYTQTMRYEKKHKSFYMKNKNKKKVIGLRYKKIYKMHNKQKAKRRRNDRKN